jgi:tetratricopeptide (TPR) repeat protein/Zn-dependent protease with chaperone function
VTSHLIISTLTALIAMAAAFLLRRRSAALRHAILLAGVLPFALPTQLLTSAGDKLASCVAVSAPSSQALADFALLLPRTTSAAAIPAIAPESHRLRDAAWLLWAAVFAASLGTWARRLLRRLPAVRQPEAPEIDALLEAKRCLKLEREVSLRIAATDRVPGASGWWRPCVILPDGLSAHLNVAELQAVRAHELAHVRRHDNLSAAAVRMIVSAFWFHPLLWWMERRMLAEREAACDELVLSHGAQPADYVSGILKVCRMSFAGPASYAGAAGSNLKDRMEQIMSTQLIRPSSPFLRAVPGALLALAVILPLSTGFLQGQAPRTLPGPNDALFRSAKDCFDQRKYPEAEALFQQLRQLEPGQSRAIMGLTEVYMAENRTDQAIRLAQAEADKNPASIELRSALGNLLVRTEQYDKAVAEFQRALDTGRNLSTEAIASLHFRIAEALRRKGNINESIREFQRAAAANPKDASPLVQLGLLMDGTGRPNEAKPYYEQILKLQPDNPVALNNLAYLKAEEGRDLDQALTMALEAHEKAPNSAEVADTLGWAYLKKNMSAEAIAAFREALQEDSSPAPAVHYHLAMALFQNGETPAALRELRTALANNPSPSDREQIKALLQKIE